MPSAFAPVRPPSSFGPAVRCRRRAAALPLLALAVGAAGCGAQGGAPFDEDAWRDGERRHREEAEAELTSDGSWLTVAGLHFLTVGEHIVGSGRDADLRLPDRFPAAAVTVSWSAEGKARARVADGVEATVAGEAFREGELAPGEDGAVLLDGRTSFWLHSSGERRALRLRDLDNPLRRDFTGQEWFGLNPKFRVEAAFERYPERRVVQAVNIRGDLEDYVSDGEAVFDWEGEEIRMQAFTRQNGNLFFILTDGTSGVETYPAARFLTTAPPEGGRVIVDFNRAENPPCGFNAFTTCPTPPPQNRLRFRVEAGERRYRAAAPTD